MQSFYNRPVQSQLNRLKAGDEKASSLTTCELAPSVEIRNRLKRALKNKWKQFFSIEFKRQSLLLFGLTMTSFVAGLFLTYIGNSFLPYGALPSFCEFVLAFMFAALAISAAPVASNLLAPSRLEFSDQGLRLHWQWWLTKIASPRISWDKMSYVGLVEHKGFIFQGSWLDFHLYARDVSAADRLCFGLFYADFWSTTDHCRISLDLAGIEYGEQPQRLLTALSLHLPAERLEPRLLDALNPIKRDSYTTLWMDSLSSSSTARIRNEPLAVGTTVGNKRYVILGQIGAGGQGIAYLALGGEDAHESFASDHRPALNSHIAALNSHNPVPKECKVVLKEFILPTHGGRQAQCRTLDSIQREADLLKQVTHPQIVHLLDFFVEDQRAYLVLEHIEGQSLRSVIEEKGCLTESRIKELGLQLCDILEHLHSQSPPVIHRDFTPENIIVGSDNTVKLIDFNVAQQLQSTATKTVVGKHSYIPPEQFRGKATPQSDIYALGATMHFMATGRDPEPISASHPTAVNSDVSEQLDAIVARATAKTLAPRYPNVAEVRDDLAKL
jgi:hypothetical protein